MAQSGRRRLDNNTGVPSWVFAVCGVFILAAVVAGWYALDQMFGADPRTASKADLPQGATPASRLSAPSPSASPRLDDLVGNAMKVKPLEDIEKGDRVLYQGHVCVWQLWNKNINTSTIRCPGGPAFQIQTGRLTPVELKTGKSKLKVQH